jgi:hypothetical protein
VTHVWVCNSLDGIEIVPVHIQILQLNIQVVIGTKKSALNLQGTGFSSRAGRRLAN